MIKYTIKTKTGDVEVHLREPEFKQISHALSILMTASGKLDMAGAGNAILQTCVEKGKDELEKDVKSHISFCLRLADEYVIPAEIEIKKN